MTVPNETIEKALRMQGYENPRRIVIDAFNVEWWEEPMNTEWSIPTDLASMLKRCLERDLQPSIDTVIVNGQPFFMAVVWPTLLPHTGKDSDPTDALLAALAAAWDAKEKP